MVIQMMQHLTNGSAVEVGLHTEFEHRTLAQELALCQRYYQGTFNMKC